MDAKGDQMRSIELLLVARGKLLLRFLGAVSSDWATWKPAEVGGIVAV